MVHTAYIHILNASRVQTYHKSNAKEMYYFPSKSLSTICAIIINKLKAGWLKNWQMYNIDVTRQTDRMTCSIIFKFLILK